MSREGVSPEAVRRLGDGALLAGLLVGAYVVGSLPAEQLNWVRLTSKGLYLAAAVTGLNLLSGYTGLLSLGHASFLVVGAWVGAVVAPDLGLSPWLGFPMAAIAGAGAGAALALMSAHLRGFYLTVVTLGFGALVTQVLESFTVPVDRRVTEPLDVGAIPFAGGDVRRGLLLLGAAVLVVNLLAVRNLVGSRWGRALRAIRESEVAAQASGIDTYQTKVVAFAISAAMVALAGVAAVQDLLVVTFDLGDLRSSFELVVMLALGGVATLAGPVVGALSLTLVFGFAWVDRNFLDRPDLFFGVLAIAVVTLAPRGVVHEVTARLPHLSHRARKEEGLPSALPDLGRQGLADAGAPLLELTGVTKHFGGVRALDDVDLLVRAGTIHGLIGPNGSGKSTLVNVVAGFYRASRGRIDFGGDDVSRLRAHARSRRGLARTFQNLQIWPDMTVRDHVLVGMHPAIARGWWACLTGLRGGAERDAQRRAGALLELVGLREVASRPARTLAFADQRRLEIARALAGRPALILLDEPAAGMNPAEIDELAGILRRLAAGGVTIVLIEHHVDFVMRASDHITVLDEGQVIADGPPDEVRRQPEVIEAYLGAAPA
jgi:branched-chain amino acid transport system permease protein